MSPFDRIFFPQQPDDDAMRTMAQGFASEIEESGGEDGSYQAFTVVDTNFPRPGGAYEVIAFGKWKIERPSIPTAKIDDNDIDRSWPGGHVGACALAFDVMEREERRTCWQFCTHS